MAALVYLCGVISPGVLCILACKGCVLSTQNEILIWSPHCCVDFYPFVDVMTKRLPFWEVAI